jgi:hypothetical protein
MERENGGRSESATERFCPQGRERDHIQEGLVEATGSKNGSSVKGTRLEHKAVVVMVSSRFDQDACAEITSA